MHVEMLERGEAFVRTERARQGHHALLVALHHALKERGWTHLVFDRAVDLWGRSPTGTRVIFEAKTISAGNELARCRMGLAQLLEYREAYGAPEDAVCLVVDRTVSRTRAMILENLGVGLLEAGSGELHAANHPGTVILTN